MNLTAVSYSRQSSLSQQDNTGISRQQDIINSWISSNNVVLMKEFSETISGTCSFRPIFNEMLEYVRQNKITYVVFERLDRVARETYVNILLRQQIKDAGAQVVIAAETGIINDDDPTQKMLTEIVSSVASYERARIVEKLRIAREKIRKELGKCEGEKLYSDEDVISLVKKMRSEGVKLQVIADTLNDANIPTKRGNGLWHPTTISRLCAR